MYGSDGQLRVMSTLATRVMQSKLATVALLPLTEKYSFCAQSRGLHFIWTQRVCEAMDQPIFVGIEGGAAEPLVCLRTNVSRDVEPSILLNQALVPTGKCTARRFNN